MILDRLPGENDDVRQQRLVEDARLAWSDEDIVIDDDAKLYEAGSGVWVQAWVWIDFAAYEPEEAA